MAYIEKRASSYLIIFSKRENNENIKKAFSLKTLDKKSALRYKSIIEKAVDDRVIDPFDPDFKAEYLQKLIDEEEKATYIQLKEATELFLKERHQATEVTKKGYRTHFRMMFEKLAESMPLSMVTENDLRELCFKKGIKVNTQRSYLRHYNAFFKWAYKKRFIQKDLTEFVIAPKEVENTQEKIISEQEMKLILKNYYEHIAEVKEKYPYVSDEQMMDWFEPVVKIGFYAGLRVKEIVNLRWMDIDLKKNLIYVRNTDTSVTKTGRFRAIPIRIELLKTLKKWHKEKFDYDDHYVFKSPTANPLMNIKIDSGNVSKKFKRFVRRSKLPESITFHGLRHSCITDLLAKNIPLHYVTRIAGHTSYQTTKRYEHLTTEDLQNAFKNLD